MLNTAIMLQLSVVLLAFVVYVSKFTTTTSILGICIFPSRHGHIVYKKYKNRYNMRITHREVIVRRL